jgi:GNAT superfamily N-acetyltransferase
MNFYIREFAPHDYVSIADIGNAIYPDYRYSPEEIRYDDEHFDKTKYLFKRYVAEVSGRVVGYAEYHHMPNMFHPQKFWLYVGVHPEFQKQGIGRALYEKIISDLRALNAVRALTSAREDYPRSIAFLQKNGFVETMRTWESRLPVATLDLKKFAHYLERFSAHGFTITTLADELKRDPNCLKKLYELYELIMEDVPHPDQHTPRGFLKHFLRYSIEHPDAIAEGYFIAKDGEKIHRAEQLAQEQRRAQRLISRADGSAPRVSREGRGDGAQAQDDRIRPAARLRSHQKLGNESKQRGDACDQRQAGLCAPASVGDVRQGVSHDAQGDDAAGVWS